MIETNGKMKVKSIKNKKLKRFAIKIHKDFLPFLKKRIEQAEESGRGVNLLFGGELVFDIYLIKSIKGDEYKINFIGDGEVSLFDWNPSIAYNGSKVFWCEGFIDKDNFEDPENYKKEGFFS